MSNIKQLSEDTLLIKQGDNSLFIKNRKGYLIITEEFMTVDGYEVGMSTTFNKDEFKELVNFLNKIEHKRNNSPN